MAFLRSEKQLIRIYKALVQSTTGSGSVNAASIMTDMEEKK